MSFHSVFGVVVLASVALSVQTPPSTQTQGSDREKPLVWRETARAERAPLRFVVRPAAPSETPPNALVFVVAGDNSEVSVERAAREVANALGDSASRFTLVSAFGDSQELAAILASVSVDVDGIAPRAHLFGTGSGARAALRFAIDHFDRVASVSALAPPNVGDEWLARARVLAHTPVALLRGREDDRAPMLELLEVWIDAGSSNASFDFLSTLEHATVGDNEGRLRDHWARFVKAEEERAAVERSVHGLLTRFHAAASRADGPAYFACLSEDAVFIGTDASERWTVPQFRAYCTPHFEAGRGWTYVGFERHVALDPTRAIAWFDERLKNDKYGEVRGSGVARREGTEWRIAHYVMSFPVPNELSKELVERIRERR